MNIGESTKQFIIENIDTLSWDKLANSITTVEGSPISKHCLRSWCQRRGIKKSDDNPHKSKKQHALSENEIQFLKDEFDGLIGYKELTNKLNIEFGTNYEYLDIQYFCRRRLGFKHDKHPNGLQGSDSKYDIGDEVIHNRQVYVKVKNDKFESGKSLKNWKLKNRLVWEEHYGKLSEDMIVVFLDGDYTNFDINNLYAMPKKFCGFMSKNKWFSSEPDLTLAGIKWCELYYTMKEGESQYE